jgi:hypothetical protein
MNVHHYDRVFPDWLAPIPAIGSDMGSIVPPEITLFGPGPLNGYAAAPSVDDPGPSDQGLALAKILALTLAKC